METRYTQGRSESEKRKKRRNKERPGDREKRWREV